MSTYNGLVKVLVTGANGFTGSHLARLLREGGHDVRALVRKTGDRSLIGNLDVELFEADLAEPARLREAVSGVERIFHIAAVYREARLSDDVYRRVNVEGTRILAEASLAEGGVPFLYCSTCGVHGEVEPPADETAPYNPGDIYQQTKVEAERVVLSLHRDRGLPMVILRPVGIYGPGDRRFLKLFKGVARHRFPMIGKGNVFYHLTHVEDVARGFIRASEASGANGEAFILAGARYTTVRELVELIAEKAGVAPPSIRLPAGPLYAAAVVCEGLCRPLGIEPPLHRRRLDFFLKDRAFNIDKARTKLGWEPRVDLDAGIAETLEWYRGAGWV
ncbi:MAG: NAD-dependent epimerase/dehydratase family protein [Acidobacteriota bacterium]|nr:NAD-dependent epimerase/dehydratase family protein [Acidobacteriota bacterium]